MEPTGPARSGRPDDRLRAIRGPSSRLNATPGFHFRLRAPRFGGLLPTEARRASVGGSFHPGYQRKQGKRNADRRIVQMSRTSGCGAHHGPVGLRRPPLRVRSPVGVPLRFLPEGLSSPQAQLQARLPGTWPERSIRYGRPNRGAEILRWCSGRYPRRPVPAQGGTSHPGHSAGRLMPEAARERS